jgi:hypothetical protein
MMTILLGVAFGTGAKSIGNTASRWVYIIESVGPEVCMEVKMNITAS